MNQQTRILTLFTVLGAVLGTGLVTAVSMTETANAVGNIADGGCGTGGCGGDASGPSGGDGSERTGSFGGGDSLSGVGPGTGGAGGRPAALVMATVVLVVVVPSYITGGSC